MHIFVYQICTFEICLHVNFPPIPDQVKLCDFGVSTQLVKSLATTFLGTNVYMAPERVQGHDYGKPAEVWSLGVTLHELATGELPFPSLLDLAAMKPFEVMKVIVEEPHARLPAGRFSAPLVDFVDRCLHKTPGLRLAPHCLTTHPFMLQGQGQADVGFDPGVIAQLVLSHRRNGAAGGGHGAGGHESMEDS